MKPLPRKEWAFALVLALAIKAAALLCLYAGWKFVPRAHYDADLWITRTDTSFIDNLANFDGAWFVRIAVLGHKKLAAGDYDLEEWTKKLRVMDQLGYDQARWPKEPGSERFDRGYAYRHWPAFAWAIEALYSAGLDPVYSAVFLSNLFAVLYGVLFYALARQDLGKGAAVLAVLLSQFHPGGYSLSGAYNESMFLLAAAASMLAARKGKWWTSGAFVALAAATRIFGVVLAAPLLYEWLEQRAEARALAGENPRIFSMPSVRETVAALYRRPLLWWLALAPAGTLIVLIYFQSVSGDAFIWTKVHEHNVHGQVSWPWLMMIETYKKGWQVWMKELPLHALLLVVLIATPRKVRGSYWLWMLLFFLYHTSNGNHSYLRYQVQCLPLFVALATLCRGREWLSGVLLALFASLFGVFAALFVNGYWTA